MKLRILVGSLVFILVTVRANFVECDSSLSRVLKYDSDHDQRSYFLLLYSGIAKLADLLLDFDLEVESFIIR